MQGKSLLSAGLVAFAVGLVATAAQAGPSGFGGAIEDSAGRSGLVDKVTWYRDGHYGHYRRPYYNYGWYGHRHYGHRHYGYGWYGKRHYGWYRRHGYRHW